MNKIIRNIVVLINGAFKTTIIKFFHHKAFKGIGLQRISLMSEITIEYGGKLIIGKKFKMRDNCKLRVRKGANCRIGNDVSFNSNNIIVCRDSITIGDGVEFGPNVQVYDHDHDFKNARGIKSNEYLTSTIKIVKYLSFVKS